MAKMYYNGDINEGLLQGQKNRNHRVRITRSRTRTKLKGFRI